MSFATNKLTSNGKLTSNVKNSPPDKTAVKALRLPSLMLSDYWFLAGLILALFYVADPFGLRLDKIGLTKHIPLLISLFGVVLVNMGNWLFRPIHYQKPNLWQVLSAGLPLILLGLWIVFGGLYTRKYNDINNSFISVGIYMLFTFLAARVMLISPARARIVRAYLVAAAMFSVLMVLRMLGASEESVSYHELEALIVPLAVYFALRPAAANSALKPSEKGYWQIFVMLFFLASGIVFQKNTGYLVLIFTLLYIWVVEWRFRFRESVSFRYWIIIWITLILAAGSATAGYLANQRGELLPSGNPQYRMHTYEIAMDKFIDSPGWGTNFTGVATEKFKGYDIKAAKGNLPTHSDVLDLAAQGGILALSLWLWGYIRITAISMRFVLKEARPHSDLCAAAHTLACMSLASIVVYAFNPILLQPAKSFLMWGQFGMLLGIALHLSSNQLAKPAVQNTKNVFNNKLAGRTLATNTRV